MSSHIAGQGVSAWSKPLALVVITGLVSAGLVAGTSNDAFAEACGNGVAPSGDGTSGSPYEIASPDNLVWLSWAASAVNTGSDPSRADALGASYRQTANIDLGGCEWTPIGDASSNAFSGVYDGRGNTITNLVVTETQKNVGLFGYLGGGEVKNVGLDSVEISGTNFVGGLVGRMNNARVSRASVSGSVEGFQRVGGLIGYAQGSSELVDSYSTATVAGFEFFTDDGRGPFDPTIVGGLIGQADGSAHERSFSIGAVSAPDGVDQTTFGGFAGLGSATTNSFWNSETSLQSTSATGEGKTTDEMTSIATFNDTSTEGLDTGWDIVDGWEAYDFDTPTNVWGICSQANDGYPFLLWEYTEDPCVVPDSGGGGDTGRNDDDDDDTAAAPVTPAPAVTSPVRPRVAEVTPAPTTAVEGPVLRGGVVSAPPRVPTVLVGGVPTIVEESSPDPTTLSVVAGSLSLGVSVDEGSGGVSRSDDGVNRLSVKAGSAAVLQGAGLQPGASVQVFIPLGVDDSRELASITVAADGTFSGELPVSTDPLAEPLPIGERLLQLVSVDADGNQVVLEMAVNVAQGDPAPALDRDAGDIPVVELGASAVTSAGVVTEATTTALPDQNLAVVEGDTWNMAVAIDSEEGGVEPTESGALVTLVRDEVAQVSGVGFMAGTRADVWLFSEPALLGTVTIDENGEFSGEVGIDPDLIPTGEHTLQLQGVGTDGYVKAANMGVFVDDAQPELAVAEQDGLDLSFIWWILAVIVLVAIVVAIWVRRSRRA